MAESLVIAPQWIGDAVMTEPLLRRLQARGERLTVGAVPWVAPVYRAMPQVAEVIEFPFQHGGLQLGARRRLARQFQGRFDTAYVLPNSLKSALLPFLAGIPQRVGYLGEARVGLLTHRLKNPGNKPPMVAFYSALSGQTEGLAQDRPALRLPPQAMEAVLAAHGLAPRSYLVFAPGAEFGPSKRWPERHYAALAADQPLPVLLLGSGKDAAVCEAIARDGGAHCRNLAGRTSLADAFALIAGARAMVSNDSGLMHVAAAFGIPQVALFGSSSPLHTPPLNDSARVVWLKDDPHYQPPLECAPCFQRECPLGHHRCLEDVAPARVAGLLQAASRS
ncbi:lipopolysaccharide heptosyltransferase II [Ramlibacter tataouinensis]|uniref:lipopolysaccharide heptosyltransferase II n=1 Tax=Ramlibacter tataouinensis (strain ATCC BAA-407 / DSM 14655 / LMG 21543 / TTB310) TaxID=365046 RepID=F5Y3X5_RAMTT|nr:lipopolysaccharide heptosyltransferase II [Ramlibacter tataouinensis]AEG91253.1 Candidate LPS heptosyltransferase, Glycosyltransferase Family 9 [Ramlibacter tataouinensis TTB310]